MHAQQTGWDQRFQAGTPPSHCELGATRWDQSSALRAAPVERSLWPLCDGTLEGGIVPQPRAWQPPRALCPLGCPVCQRLAPPPPPLLGPPLPTRASALATVGHISSVACGASACPSFPAKLTRVHYYYCCFLN